MGLHFGQHCGESFPNGADGFGALLLLSCAGMVGGPPWVYAGLMGLSACLSFWGGISKEWSPTQGLTGLLASMRVHLYGTIRKLAPACLMDREKGDLLNIAVSDIETVEFFFAHTIGPMFTVILLPLRDLRAGAVVPASVRCRTAAGVICGQRDVPLGGGEGGPGNGHAVPRPAGGDEIPGAGERLRPAGYPDFRLWRPAGWSRCRGRTGRSTRRPTA